MCLLNYYLTTLKLVKWNGNYIMNGFFWLTGSFNIMPNKIVYLKASPDVSFKRIKKRSRTEESTIPFSYIQKVSQEHDNWLNNYENLTLIDADIEFENNHKRTVEILKTIFDEINLLLS